MPYIVPARREKLDTQIERLVLTLSAPVPGEVNYVITCILDRLYNNRNVGYAGYNTALGILEAVKLELYRRVIAPYEDAKKHENGEVYGNYLR